MTRDILRDIWDGSGEEQEMTTARIQRILEPRIKKNALSLRMLVQVYVLVIVVTALLSCVNVYGYRSNPVMLALQLAASGLCFAFLGYGIHLLVAMARIERADDSVLATVRRRLRFQRGKMEAWMWIVALTAYLLQFAVNTMIDNQDGVYRINQVGFFIGVSIGMVLFIYAVMKIAQYPIVRELEAIQSDLENQVTESTEKVAIFRKTWRLWSIIVSILLSLVLIWGILQALSAFD